MLLYGGWTAKSWPPLTEKADLQRSMGHRGHRGIGTRPIESGQSRDPLGLCIERIMPPRKDRAARLAGEGKSPISISFVNQLG